MRVARVKVLGEGIHHCMSRTVDGVALFNQREKEMLRQMIHQIADFSGVEVLTFCLMQNHFHLLVKVSPQDSVSDEELIRRYAVLYPKPTKYQVVSREAMARELRTNGAEADAIRSRLLARMGDLSAFMKTLKQRFSTWFNKSHDRFGPLWSDRFKSVLVEGAGYALQTIAAYIDLNPVRAGLVDDPKDYRYCGYAEAVAGQKAAMRGLQFVTAGLYDVSASEALATYRRLLFGKGGAPVAGAAKVDRQQAVRVLGLEQGHLPAAVLLRCRVRYFSEGVVLGSQEFVNAHADAWKRSNQRRFTPKPQSILDDSGGSIAVMRGVRGCAYS